MVGAMKILIPLLFDGTKFAIMTQLTDGVFFLVFRKN